MPTIINRLHGASATFLNRKDGTPGRKVWWNYWDTCIRNESDFYTRFNYIHNNPIKHKYVNKLIELPAYEFSSYPYYLRTNGQEWVNDIFMRYPIVDYVEKYDDY